MTTPPTASPPTTGPSRDPLCDPAADPARGAPPDAFDPRADDVLQPFQLDPFAVRGRLVRLGPLVDTILRQHDYPIPVATLLGEAIVLAVALAGALKYDGIFTLQTKGDGPVRLLVADVTTTGAVRGYAQYDEARLRQVMAEGRDATGSVPRLLGAGYLAFTVDQGEHTDRYQGIVELQGATLAECIHHYFRQSEQIEAGIKVAVGRTVAADGSAGPWRAGGLMIQRLPGEGGHSGSLLGGAARERREAEAEDWRRAVVLMSSCTSAELVDPALAPAGLLFRLFHEEGARLYRAHRLEARCRCSRERIERVLGSLPEEDLASLKLDGRVEVTCEFCNATYAFEAAALDRLPLAAGAAEGEVPAGPATEGSAGTA